MAGENFAGSIIVSLASLPDFLRQPILTKRMGEFFDMSEPEKQEIIHNALEAGPGVDFGRFEKLFKTWLEVLASMPAEQREELVGRYVQSIVQNPESLIAFNMDGILGIFLTLRPDQRESIASSVRKNVSELDGKGRRIVRLVVADTARQHLGIW